MNWSHSGGILNTVGLLWVVAAILVVADVSADVWFACGVVATALAVANALQSVRQKPARAEKMTPVSPVSPVVNALPPQQSQLADSGATRFGLVRS